MVSLALALASQLNDHILYVSIDSSHTCNAINHHSMSRKPFRSTHTLWLKAQPISTTDNLYISVDSLIFMRHLLDEVNFTFQKINGQHFVVITSANPRSHVVKTFQVGPCTVRYECRRIIFLYVTISVWLERTDLNGKSECIEISFTMSVSVSAAGKANRR